MTITLDRLSVQRFEELTSKNLKRAAKVALNKTSKDIRDLAIKTIVTKYGFQKGRVSKTIFYRKATESQLFASVIFGGRAGVPLIFLQPRSRAVDTSRGIRRGVTVKLGPDGPRTLAPGAFFGTARGSGKKLVFERYGRSRVPITQARAKITFGELFKDKELEALIKTRANNLGKTFESELAALAKAGS